MEDAPDLLTHTADIVSAHVANNAVAVGEVAGLVRNVHDALANLRAAPPAPKPVADQTPAVSARASVKPDYLVCMKCGKRQKMLKRHLDTAHQMTPGEYRQAFSLPTDYPMVAATYAASRREMALSIGLGRKRAAPTPKRARRPRAATTT